MTDPSGPENDAEGPFPIDPHDLLRHAADIAESPPGRGDTDYRRAVSAAYYALYHALTLRAATLAEPSRQYDAVRRFRHWRLRDVARTVSGGGDARAASIARAVLFLQSERVHADYNHREQFMRQRAQDAINFAARAVAALEGGDGEALARRLATMLDAP